MVNQVIVIIDIKLIKKVWLGCVCVLNEEGFVQFLWGVVYVLLLYKSIYFKITPISMVIMA